MYISFGTDIHDHVIVQLRGHVCCGQPGPILDSTIIKSPSRSLLKYAYSKQKIWRVNMKFRPGSKLKLPPINATKIQRSLFK